MRKKALVFQVIMLVLVNSLAAYKKDGLTKKLFWQKAKEGQFQIQNDLNDPPVFLKSEFPGVYIVTSSQNRGYEVKRLTKEMVAVEIFGIKRGQGPGEVISPCFLVSNGVGEGAGLFVLDRLANKVLLFSGNNKLEKEIKLDIPGEVLARGLVFDYKEMALFAFVRTREPFMETISFNRISLLQGDSQRKILYEKKVKARTKEFRTVLGVPVHAMLIGDNVYLVDLADYTIIKYDKAGNERQRARIPFQSNKTNLADNRKAIVDLYGEDYAARFLYPEELWPASWIMGMNGKLVVARRDSYNTDEKQIRCDVFSENLKLEAEIDFPFIPYWNEPVEGPLQVERYARMLDHKLLVLVVDEEDYSQNKIFEYIMK